MKHWILSTFVILLISCTKAQKAPTEFSFHLFQEPLHLDPALSRASSASYFFYNTLRGLYRFDAATGLQPEGGSCQWITELKLHCKIDVEHKWSDGSAVSADDYLRSFQHLIDISTASPRSHTLEKVKNVKKILEGKLTPQELGIKVTSQSEFLIEFAEKDPEFLYKLSSTALYPQPKNQAHNREDWTKFLSNGPYKIQSWSFGKELKLIPNPFYKKGHPQRPPVKIFFIDNEMTAFRLYENGRLSFLRRVPTNLIDKIKDRNDFFQVPMARYDYIGFGEKLIQQPSLRKALLLSVNYKDFQTLLRALGRPGCPSLPPEWMDKVPCYDFDLKTAQEELKKVPKEILNQHYQMKVSAMGGEDIHKQAVFLQNQWKKHLGLNIEISQLEQKVFLSELNTNPPDIFRKGIGLDRPTCLSGLESFSEEGQQNFSQWKSKEYEELLNKIGKTQDENTKKTLCRKAIEMVMDHFWVMPLGEMHFTLLAQPHFKGWSMNSMNQLDLSQLHPVNP